MPEAKTSPELMKALAILRDLPPPPPATPDPRDLALDEIGRLAMGCWMDMQGRLTDDEHRRAHGVLARIAALAAALPKSST